MITLPEPAKCGGVEPRTVEICSDEHDGHFTRDAVEEVAVGEIAPERVAKPVADKRWGGVTSAARELFRHQLRSPGSALGARQIETRPHLRPLVEVHVVVPQAREHEAAARR